MNALIKSKKNRLISACAVAAATALAVGFFWTIGYQLNSAKTLPTNPLPGYAPGSSRRVKQPDNVLSQSRSSVAPSAKELRPGNISQQYAGAAPDQVNIDALPPISDKIIKTGSLTVKVKRSGFEQAFDRAVLLAEASGGYVAGSSSSSAARNISTAVITIRVPAAAFEKTVTELKKLGKVQSIDTQSQDVSQEFVDLDSRLRNWRSQESILLGLMEKAQSVADSIAIQNQLSQVQQQIEEITGRLNFLKNQTGLSTIQLTIAETGVVPMPQDRWGFRTALSQAAHAFVDTLNGFVIAMGYLVPIALMAALLYALIALYRRRLAGEAATNT